MRCSLKGGVLTNGISALITATKKSAVHKSEVASHQNASFADTLSFEIQPPELGEINFCCL